MTNIFTGECPTGPYSMVPYIRWTACCHSMRVALDDRSDNEGYGSLVNIVHGKITFGSAPDSPVKVCPWCGKEISVHTNARGYLEDMIRREIDYDS